MIIDADARQQALNPEQSYIVQAPAGSGKTGLLVYRYLTLLSRVEKPQNVLAITFTRKARSEMRERVIELLLTAQAYLHDNANQSSDPFEQQGIDLAAAVLTRDDAADWQILAAPHQLQILTIDAFSAKLAASMPWLSRLGERPKTTDAADAHFAFAVEQLFDELLIEGSELATPLNMVLLELDYNYDKARRLFASMLAKRDQWLRHLVQQDMAQMKVDLEQAWSMLLTESLAKLHRVLSDATLEPLLALAISAAQRIDFDDPKSTQSLRYLADFDGSTSDLEHRHWCALADFVLVKTKDSVRKRLDKHIGFPAGKYDDKTRCTELFEQLRDDTNVIHGLAEVSQLPSPVFSDYDWQRLVALEAVLKALAARLQLRFRAVSECDHSEVTQRANMALAELNNPTDLGLLMDGQIHHILVDEFQDTSNSQLDLLKKLTAGWEPHDSPARTLFLVGDPMQSIYRFREADVGLFLQVANNALTGVFDNIDIGSLALSQNFRSTQVLVDWFNRTFTQSFPNANDVLTGAITYAAAHSSKTSDERAPVSYHLVSTPEQEANALLRSVQSALAELAEPSKLAEPTELPGQPDEQAQIAILVRTRSQLEHLLPVLDQYGIDYAAVDIQPLHEQQAIQDVVALCQAICREDHKLAWLALLRGPWCGLTLDEIHCFNHTRDLSLWQAINLTEWPLTLTPDSQTRLRRFIGVMQLAMQQHQQVDLGSLTRWAWQRLGGHETLIATQTATQIDDVEQVFELLNRLQNGGDLPSEKDLNAGLQRLRACSKPGAAPKVVVSTIHKAKGLQYHTVILPGLAGKSRSDDREILMWAEHQAHDGQTNLLLAPLLFDSSGFDSNTFTPNTSSTAGGSHYHYLRQLDSKRAMNEVMRLMYVACTRAEKRLVLIGRAKQKAGQVTDELSPPIKTSLLASIWPALSGEFESRFEHPAGDLATQPAANSDDQTLSQTLTRLPVNYRSDVGQDFVWQAAEQLTRPDNNPNNDPNNEDDEGDENNDNDQDDTPGIAFDWATEVAAGVGVLLHNFLQFNAHTVFNVTVDDELKRRWRAELASLRVPDNRIEHAVQRLVSAVENIQSDEQARFIFADYASAQNEYAIATLDNGAVKQYRLDRTFIDESGTRWIIDYKSTTTRNTDVGRFIDTQIAERHRAQLDRYGALMSQLDDRPIKLAVYFPLLKQLRTWDYAPNELIEQP